MNIYLDRGNKMLINQHYSNSDINHRINGEGKVIYEDEYTYSGQWKNGMKVGEGTLEMGPFKIRIKTKQGHIHKCLGFLGEMNFTLNKVIAFPLPNLKIIKEGESYKEKYSNSKRLYFFIKDNTPLFGGKAYSIINFKNFSTSYRKIVVGQLKDSISTRRSILQFNTNQISFSGYSMNLIPNGDCEFFFEYIKFKGNLKGNYFNGPCIVKFPDYKIIFDTYINQIKFPVKVSLNDLKTELFFSPDKTDSFFNVEGKKSFLVPMNRKQDIAASILNSCKILRDLTTHRLLSMAPSLIPNLLVVDTKWISFEQKIKLSNKYFDCEIKKKSKTIENKSKILLRFENKQRFEGIIVNGKFEGFGKYFYADGSVYVGEFKNNLKNGLGTFKFNDGRMYKGYWADDLMHGKGCMVNGDIKIYGNWERNKIKQGRGCVVYDRRIRLV